MGPKLLFAHGVLRRYKQLTMFGLSGEHLLILAGVLLIFGPRKLPELGASVGRALRNFKEGFNNSPPSGSPDLKRTEFQATATPVEQIVYQSKPVEEVAKVSESAKSSSDISPTL